MGLFFGIAHAATAVEGHGAAAVEHGAMPAEHGSAGLPQLAIETFGSQIPWLVVTLVVLYLILTKVALPSIGGIIGERKDSIEDDLDRAGELKRRAAETEQAYEQALADARAQAKQISDATRAAIQKEVDAAIAKADAEISAKTAEGEKRIAEIRAGALASVEQVAVDVAEALVAKIAPEATDAKAVKAGVTARLGN